MTALYNIHGDRSHHPYSRPLSTPPTGLPSSHHFAPPVSPRSAASTAALCLQFQISVTTHQRHQLHPQQQHQPQRHHPQCPHLQQQHRINRPHPAATPQTPPPLSSHCRSQAESQTHFSCAAISSGNKLQKARKKETEALHTK